MLFDEHGRHDDRRSQNQGSDADALFLLEAFTADDRKMCTQGIIYMNAGPQVGRCVCPVQSGYHAGEDIVSGHHRGTKVLSVGPQSGYDQEDRHACKEENTGTQRDLMNPDEVLRLENRKCLALFKGHKPALLYKMTPEELPDYAGLTTCRVIDYIPEWRRKEAEAAPQKKASVQKEPSNIPKPPDNEKQPDRSGQPPAYDLAEDDEIGMVECTVDSILDM